MVMMRVWFIGLREHFGEFAGKSMVRPLFWVCLFSRNSRVRFWGLILWLSWVGRPPSLPRHVGVEFLNVGIHGDLALEVGVDFLAVAEHRLIPARVRSEWSRLRKKGFASLWAPANQDSFHVGNVISMRGALLLSLPSLLLSLSGSWIACMLPLGAGGFMHLVVLYGYQGADSLL